MQTLASLFQQGGQIFWVAPSGGRDRPDPEIDDHFFQVANFDSKAIDMFKMLAIQSGHTKIGSPPDDSGIVPRRTRFFPVAMFTHQLVPPPKTSATATLGETRSAKRGEVSVHILEETNGLGGLKDK
jgi:glycerol-3-phosphate O-acyltransferase